jgi:alpha-galactosidase
MKPMEVVLGMALLGAPPPATAQAPQARALATVELRSQVATGSCIDLNAARGIVVLWSCHGGANQKFVHFDDGTLRHDGRCVGTRGASLVLKACDASPDTRWTFADGQVRNDRQQCLDIAGGHRANGTAVLAWSCHGAAEQRWRRR